jgi:hypothetical protein
MNADKGADKLRHAAELESGPGKDAKKKQRHADTAAAAAHPELTRPDISKGRPTASNGETRPSNSGTDGP